MKKIGYEGNLNLWTSYLILFCDLVF